MTLSRRTNLQGTGVQAGTHAGLWLDKYIDLSKDIPRHRNPRFRLVEQVSKITEPGVYEKYYDRWISSLGAVEARTGEAEIEGRLAVNLGAESVLETSIALHRTYGLPYIPGSALKGLAAMFTRVRMGPEWAEGKDAYKVLFGQPDYGGHLIWYDAIYIPGSAPEGRPLWPDVITVHHPKYYQGGDLPPADWDSPTPVPFLTARGKFLVAIGGPQAWTEAAFKILTEALKEMGAGAKTTSGYGRMVLVEVETGAEVEGGTGEPVRLPGRVRYYNNQEKIGELEDENGQSYKFTGDVLPVGWTPPQKQIIWFKLRPGDDQVLEVKRRY